MLDAKKARELYEASQEPYTLEEILKFIEGRARDGSRRATGYSAARMTEQVIGDLDRLGFVLKLLPDTTPASYEIYW